MAGKSKELSQDLPNLIVAKPNDGIGYRRIPKLLNVPVSTVGAIIRTWKDNHFTMCPGLVLLARFVKRIIRRVVREARTSGGEPSKRAGMSRYCRLRENRM